MKLRRDRAPLDPQVAAAQESARRRRRIIFALVIVVLVIIGYFVGAAFLPRWWARRVGDWVNGSFTKGWLYGLAFGIVFTLVPLLVASLALIRRFNNKVRAVILVLAVVLATPNLLTLGISTGSGGGAHAGSRVLDLDAPFFQGASLIGAIVAVVIFALGVWQYRANKRVRAAKKDAKTRRRADESRGSVDTTPPATS